MKKVIYVAVNGTNSSNYDGGYKGYWVNKYTEDEFNEFYNNEITFSELIGMSRVEFEGVFNSEDDAWKHIEKIAC